MPKLTQEFRVTIANYCSWNSPIGKSSQKDSGLIASGVRRLSWCGADALRVFIGKADCCVESINLRQSQDEINSVCMERLGRGLNCEEVTIRFVALCLGSLTGPAMLNIQVETSAELIDVIAGADSIISSIESGVRGFIVY